MNKNKTRARPEPAGVGGVNILSELWDTPNFLLLMLETFGIEFVDQDDSLISATPVFIRCSYEAAMKIGESDIFKVELCGDDLWRIKLQGVNYPHDADDYWVPWSVKNRKEQLTRKAELWLDMVIESSHMDKRR